MTMISKHSGTECTLRPYKVSRQGAGSKRKGDVSPLHRGLEAFSQPFAYTQNTLRAYAKYRSRIRKSNHYIFASGYSRVHLGYSCEQLYPVLKRRCTKGLRVIKGIEGIVALDFSMYAIADC